VQTPEHTAAAGQPAQDHGQQQAPTLPVLRLIAAQAANDAYWEAILAARPHTQLRGVAL